MLEVRLVADQTDLHGGTAARELNWSNAGPEGTCIDIAKGVVYKL